MPLIVTTSGKRKAAAPSHNQCLRRVADWSSAISVVGWTWAIGWESGRKITQTSGYQSFKQKKALPWRRKYLGY